MKTVWWPVPLTLAKCSSGDCQERATMKYRNEPDKLPWPGDEPDEGFFCTTHAIAEQRHAASAVFKVQVGIVNTVTAKSGVRMASYTNELGVELELPTDIFTETIDEPPWLWLIVGTVT